jgi:hypothetical protein
MTAAAAGTIRISEMSTAAGQSESVGKKSKKHAAAMSATSGLQQ